MPKNEDGEFELVMGNRQLLSVFFVIVVLLGVFFTMGYIVGRNSTPVPVEARTREAKNVVVDSPRPAPAAGARELPAETPPDSAKDRAAAEEKKPVMTKPAESASPTPEEPAPGETYLQVVAVQRTEAELFVDVLAKKGFHALYTPVPDAPNMYRVLVGPFKDSAAIAQARTDLQKAGFKGFDALVRKY
jgi:cell division septation protein DedD